MYLNNYTNYANVTYDALPYNMASATATIVSNKCKNCRFVTMCKAHY